jgi:hypothetical protein
MFSGELKHMDDAAMGRELEMLSSNGQISLLTSPLCWLLLRSGRRVSTFIFENYGSGSQSNMTEQHDGET